MPEDTRATTSARGKKRISNDAFGEVEMNSDSCLVCGGNFCASKVSGLLTCKDCKFTTADLTISEEELKQLYTANYFAGDEYRDYIADRPVLEKQFRLRLRRLLKFVPEADKKNLFEIGCAHGFFLASAEKKFHSAEGIDISSDATRYARENLGVNATSSEFLTHEFVRAPDVVCMWDTIEHIRRPDLYIEKIANTIPKGGLLAVTTADLDSWVARARGSKWRQIHPPTHLHYFSCKTLSKLLDRNGLEIKHIGSEGMYRRVETMAYIILCLKQNRPILYNCLRKTGVLNWDLYLNLGDIVFAIAEKV
jgi:2-polyprenyl-3-methyl-5-hydroxy-6-metoxy-1,4-benzoquinol methylase